MNEFKDQLDAAEKEKVTKLAAKGQAGDGAVTSEQIRETINETQQASLGLFHKVYEKRNAEETILLAVSIIGCVSYIPHTQDQFLLTGGLHIGSLARLHASNDLLTTTSWI
jgi:hypothetical protein